MNKIIAILLLAQSIAGYCNAQSEVPTASQTASQAAKLSLSDVLELTFSVTGGDGVTVILPFTSVNDYIDGVESSEQEIRIRSNKGFNIRVAANSRNFTYTGTASPSPVMKVSDVLNMKITENNTEGVITGGFSNYKSLSSSSKKILNKCSNRERAFKVKYKAVPGFTYPAGDYSAQIVFTATQD